MADLLLLLLALICAVAIFLVLMALINACVAKAVTGKWPHQSSKSKQVYDALNGAGGPRHD